MSFEISFLSQLKRKITRKIRGKRLLIATTLISCMILASVGLGAAALWSKIKESSNIQGGFSVQGEGKGSAVGAGDAANLNKSNGSSSKKTDKAKQKSTSGTKKQTNKSSTSTNKQSTGSTGGSSGGGSAGGGTTAPPPLPAHSTYIGACPANPGGQSLSAATTVISKWGSGSAIRQFFSSDLTRGPNHPVGASVVHSSYKPSVSAVNSGSLDNQIKALIQRTPAGDIIEFYHEPDNDGLNPSGITAMIAAKNRLYDLKQQVKPSVKVAATMTGGFFANYSSESKRAPWYGLRGDLIGLDADGVYDTSGPTYDISYTDEIAGVKAFMTHSSSWKGWTVPEFGTARQPWDMTGSARASWLSQQMKLFVDGGAYAVMLFDYNTSGHDTSTNYNQIKTGTPEFTVWKNAIAGNP